MSSHFPSPLSPLRLSLILLALAVLAFVVLDYANSGPIVVRNAEVSDLSAKNTRPQRLETIKTRLPYIVSSRNPRDLYRFMFVMESNVWDRFATRQLVADDCIEALTLDNAQRIAPPPPGSKRCTRSFSVPYQTRVVDVLVNDMYGGAVALSLVRDGILSPVQAGATALLMAYAVFMLLHDAWRPLVAAQRPLFLLGLFVASAWPIAYLGGINVPYVWPDWKAWTAFMAYGPVMFAIAFAAWCYAPTRKLHVLADQALTYANRIPPHRFALITSVVFLLVAAVLSQLLFGGLPHVADTHIQYMMGRVFSEGKLVEMSHPLPRFFDFQFTINDGKYYGHYFPGHSFLIAIGLLVKAPWLVNPLCGAASVYVVFLLARELAGNASGKIAALLMLFSPLVMFMSAEYMAHSSCLLFLTAFLYAYIRLVRTNRLRYALLAGFCLGYAALIRAQSAAPFSLPVAFHALWLLYKAPKKRAGPILAMGAALLPFVLFLFYYNMLTTGSPWLTPYQQTSQEARLVNQFADPARWLWLHHDFMRTATHITNLHADLMGWPFSPFVFILLMYLFRLQPAGLGLLYACFFGFFFGLAISNNYWQNVSPSRYFFETMGLFVVLSAIGIARFPLIMQRALNMPAAVARTSIALTLAAAVLLAWPYRVQVLYSNYANNFWEGNANYHQTLMDSVKKPALLFMKNFHEYRFNFFTGPPRDSDAVIFAQDRGPENQQLMDYYKDRHPYLIDGWRFFPLR